MRESSAFSSLYYFAPQPLTHLSYAIFDILVGHPRSDECEAARHDRDRARADCAAALVQVEATKTETRRMVDAAEAKAAAAIAERDLARQTAHAAAAEKVAALQACEVAHTEKRAALSARDEALRLKGEADARAALEVIAREFATKERERVEAAMDRVRCVCALSEWKQSFAPRNNE